MRNLIEGLGFTIGVLGLTFGPVCLYLWLKSLFAPNVPKPTSIPGTAIGAARITRQNARKIIDQSAIGRKARDPEIVGPVYLVLTDHEIKLFELSRSSRASEKLKEICVIDYSQLTSYRFDRGKHYDEFGGYDNLARTFRISIGSNRLGLALMKPSEQRLFSAPFSSNDAEALRQFLDLATK